MSDSEHEELPDKRALNETYPVLPTNSEPVNFAMINNVENVQERNNCRNTDGVLCKDDSSIKGNDLNETLESSDPPTLNSLLSDSYLANWLVDAIPETAKPTAATIQEVVVTDRSIEESMLFHALENPFLFSTPNETGYLNYVQCLYGISHIMNALMLIF